jgi:hypothetical protein
VVDCTAFGDYRWCSINIQSQEGKMKQITIILAALLLLSSQIACCCGIPTPQMPDIEISIPTLEVGETQDKQETIPLAGAESAIVEILFGAGELKTSANALDQLFSGYFRYNVKEWEPEVTYEDSRLTIKQGNLDTDLEDWGIPTEEVHNEWELEFSPQIPLKMDIQVGAGSGDLDFTGLQLEELDLKMGAGDFEVRFDEANEAEMGDLTLSTGASQLNMTGIGNASPEWLKVEGGVGDITLDFTGAWSHSADVEITGGVGLFTLRLPDDLGVQVEIDGLSNVESSGLRQSGDGYVNDAFGESEIELHIQITTGIGNIRLIEVSN